MRSIKQAFAFGILATAAGGVLVMMPSAQASSGRPADCRSLNLLSSAVFPEGYIVKGFPPSPYSPGTPSYKCNGGKWEQL